MTSDRVALYRVISLARALRRCPTNKILRAAGPIALQVNGSASACTPVLLLRPLSPCLQPDRWVPIQVAISFVRRVTECDMLHHDGWGTAARETEAS